MRNQIILLLAGNTIKFIFIDSICEMVLLMLNINLIVVWKTIPIQSSYVEANPSS